MDPGAATRLARELMLRHGLVAWSVGLDRAKTRAGACHFRDRRITLSGPLTRLHSEAEVTETILHEIAHALVGPQHGHDGVWRAAARRIGATGERCVPESAPRLVGDWTGRCPRGHEVSRHRRPTRVVSCSRCSPVFDARFLFAWTRRGDSAPMHPRYAADLAQLEAATPAAVRTWRPSLGDLVRLRRADGADIVGSVEFVGTTSVQVRVEDIGLLKLPLDVVHPTPHRPQIRVVSA